MPAVSNPLSREKLLQIARALPADLQVLSALGEMLQDIDVGAQKLRGAGVAEDQLESIATAANTAFDAAVAALALCVSGSRRAGAGRRRRSAGLPNPGSGLTLPPLCAVWPAVSCPSRW